MRAMLVLLRLLVALSWPVLLSSAKPSSSAAGAAFSKVERVGVFACSYSTSFALLQVMKGLDRLKKPASILRKDTPPQPISKGRPEEEYMEGLCKTHTASLFALSSSSKKKGDGITFGRLYDGKILDSFSVAPSLHWVEEGGGKLKKTGVEGIEGVPAFVFLGRHWLSDKTLSEFKNFLVDSFQVKHGRTVGAESVRTALVFTAHNATSVALSRHSILLEDGGRVVLSKAQTFFTFEMKASKLASVDVMRGALGLDKELSKEKIQKQKAKRETKKIKRAKQLTRLKTEELRSKGQIPEKAELDDFLKSQRADRGKVYL